MKNNIQAKIDELRAKADMLAAYSEVMYELNRQLSWYMEDVINEETGEVMTDEDGHAIKKAPSEDNWRYDRYNAWKTIIGLVEKYIDKL